MDTAIFSVSSISDFSIEFDQGEDDPFVINFIRDGINLEIGRFREDAPKWLSVDRLASMLSKLGSQNENVIHAVISLREEGLDICIEKFRDWTTVHAYGQKVLASEFSSLSVEEIKEKIKSMSPDQVKIWCYSWKERFSSIRALKSIRVDDFNVMYLNMDFFGEIQVRYGDREKWNGVLLKIIEICSDYERSHEYLQSSLEVSPLLIKEVGMGIESGIVPSNKEGRLISFEKEKWNGTFYLSRGIDVEPLRSMFSPDSVFKLEEGSSPKISPIDFRAKYDGNDLIFGYSWSRTESWGSYLSSDERIMHEGGSETISGYKELGRFPACMCQE